MIKKYINNQKGMTLPLVITVFMVAMILGASVVTMSGSDNMLSIHQDHKTQAYYLAKSGAETMAKYIIDKSTSDSFIVTSQFLDSISNKTSTAAGVENGSIVIQTVKRTESGQDKLDLISTATYGNASETVILTLAVTIETGSGEFNPSTEENALFTLSDDPSVGLQLTGGAFLEGNIMINATREHSIVFNGGGGYNIRNGALFIPNTSNPHFVIQTDRGANFNQMPAEYENPGLGTGWISNWAFWENVEDGVKYSTMPTYPSAQYPEPVFPEFPSIASLPVPADLNFRTPWVSGLYYPITSDGYYNSIIPESSRTITIDLAGGDRIIRVGELDLTGGNIELINTTNGKLKIYVDTKFVIGSSRTLNYNGDPNLVQIYYAGTQEVVMDGSSSLIANIFVKQADIDFTAGANMKGNITTLGAKVEVSGGTGATGMILYAPNALVDMSGSAQIKGSVISNSFRRSGGGNAGIIFTPATSSVPEDFFGVGSNNISIEYDVNPWHSPIKAS